MYVKYIYTHTYICAHHEQDTGVSSGMEYNLNDTVMSDAAVDFDRQLVAINGSLHGR